MKQILPALAVIGAGILWGLLSLFVRTLSAAGLDAVQITCIRMAVAAPALMLFTAIRSRDKLPIRLRDIWMFVGTGIVSIVLFNVCYFYTLIRSEASVAVILLYTSPVFILLLSAVLFREKITPLKLIALVMTVLGCVLVAGLTGAAPITPFVLLTGLASGLFYGLYTIFGRFALRKYDALTVTAWTFLLGLIGSAPVSRPGEIVRILAAQPSLLIWCIVVGLLCTVMPFLLYTWGLARMESGKAAILAAVEPMVGAVIGMTILHESRSMPKIAGILLILTAIVLLNLPQRKTPGSA